MPVDFDDLMKGLYPAVSTDDQQDAGNMIIDWPNTQGYLQDKYLLSDPQVNDDHQLVEGTSNGQHLFPGSLETNASCEFDNINFDFPWPTDNQLFVENAYSIESLKTNHEMPYGKECQDSAVYLEASVSGFKRNCTEVGSNPWTDSNRVLETVWTIEGNNIPNSITECKASKRMNYFDLTWKFYKINSPKFFLSKTLFQSAPDIFQTVESLQIHGNKGKETADTFKGDAATLLQNYSNVPRGKALANEFEAGSSRVSIESLMLDARANTFQPPQNGIPCEDRHETCTTSSHKRKRQEKETHFEIQNDNISISQTAFGTTDILNSITDHTHMGAQPSLNTILTLPLNFENVKLLFNKLIVLPLEDLADPGKESCLKKALSILEDNYYHLLSAVEGKKILEVSIVFPVLLVHWRLFCSQSQMHSQQSSAKMENIKNLTVTASKDKENLKVKLEGVKNRKKELMKQLEALQKEEEEIIEQMNEKSNTMISLEEKSEACIFEEEIMTRVATNTRKELSTQWAMYSTISH